MQQLFVTVAVGPTSGKSYGTNVVKVSASNSLLPSSVGIWPGLSLLFPEVGS